MKFLKFVSAIAYFHIAGFLLATLIILVAHKIGSIFGVSNGILLFVLPFLLALGLSLYFSRKYYYWLSEQSTKRQLYVSVPVILIFSTILMLEIILEKETNLESGINWLIEP